jgi:hypothetical protein
MSKKSRSAKTRRTRFWRREQAASSGLPLLGHFSLRAGMLSVFRAARPGLDNAMSVRKAETRDSRIGGNDAGGHASHPMASALVR